MSRARFFLLASLLTPAALAACTTGSGGLAEDGGLDAVVEAESDATTDVVEESATEGGSDAAPEAAFEASLDAPLDVREASVGTEAGDAAVEGSVEAEAGPPAPKVVLSDAPNATALFSDGTSLYWIDRIDSAASDGGGPIGRVMSVPVGGGTEVTLATTPGAAPVSLALDATHAYFTDVADNVWQVSKTGTPGPVLLATSDEAGPLAASGSFVYYGAGGGVTKVAVATPDAGASAPVPLATSGNPADLVVVAGDVFWANPTAGQLQYVPAGAGGTPSTLLGPDPEAGTGEFVSASAAQNLVTDGTSLYWNRLPSGTYPGAIMTISVGGGSPAVVVNVGSDTPYSVVTDGSSLFYIDFGSSSTALTKTSVGGSPVALTTSGLAAANIAGATGPTVAVDSASVYWLDPPQILKLAK